MPFAQGGSKTQEQQLLEQLLGEMARQQDVQAATTPIVGPAAEAQDTAGLLAQFNPFDKAAGAMQQGLDANAASRQPQAPSPARRRQGKGMSPEDFKAQFLAEEAAMGRGPAQPEELDGNANMRRLMGFLLPFLSMGE